MAFSLTQYTLYLILAPLTASLAIGIAAYAQHHYPSSVSRRMSWLVGMTAGWLICNTVELYAPTPQWTLLWAKVSYLFIPAVAVAWYAFALTYTGHQEWLVPKRFLPFCIVPVVSTVLTWTNQIHGLIWQQITYIPVGDLLAMNVTHGPWFWLLVIHSYFLITVGACLIIRQSLHTYSLYRWQSFWLALGALVPILFNLIYIFRLFPDLTKDYTGIGFSIAGIAFAAGMARHHLFDLKPVARDTLIDNMRDPMFVLDDQNRVIDLNRAAMDATKDDVDAILGRSIGSLLSSDSKETAIGELQGKRHEISLSRRGETRIYDLQASPLCDPNGETRGQLVVLHDITDRKLAETRLNQRTTELEARNRELDSFAHTVAHDLKNPLTTVLGFAELLSMTMNNDDPDGKEMIESILQSGTQMYSLIQEILLLSRVREEEVSIKSMAMAPVVDEAIHHLRQLIDQTGADIKVQTQWPRVLGHAPWVTQVWINYISNALKYGGPSPRVELGVSQLPSSPGQTQQIRLWVRDHGSGIPAEKQEKLFNLFSRLENRSDSHGLGLSIVERIVTRLGGTVGVDSQEGIGSTFWFTLPADPDKPSIRSARHRSFSGDASNVSAQPSLMPAHTELHLH